MYRPDRAVHSRPPPPVFGPLPPHGAPFRGPFVHSAPDSLYPQSRPPQPHFTPPCNSFSVARNTAIALGGSQQIIPPAEAVHLQVPHWTPTPPLEHPPPDSSEKAGEEFLRCIADNKPLPDYLKKNMAYDLAEALKSASILKEAMKSNPEYQKHKARSKSRSRSHSRGRSRGRSRAKSHGQCKSRGRSRSKARSKSRVRGKSRARSRARSRSRSWSRKQSHAKSKSRARRSRSRSNSETSCSEVKKRKRSHSGSSSVSSSYNPTANSLLEGLKMIMSSKDLEQRLPSLKNAILNTKVSDKSTKVQCLSGEFKSLQAATEENLSTQENDNMLLPHERVGSDFSWLQGQSEEDASVQKAKELEEEESFLYGNPLCSQSQQLGPLVMISGNLLHHKQPLQTHLLASASSCLDNMEFEKVKNILKDLGTSSDMSEPTEKVQRQTEQCAGRLSSDTAASLALPALGNPDVRQALESLQSLIKATKDKRVKSEGLSQTSFDEYKAGNSEQRKPEKPDRMKKMESMEKELEDLLKQDGLTFLTPVIGFYCQKCEEFIGDFNSAEKHSAIHNSSNPSSHKPQMNKDGKDSERNSQNHKHSRVSERRDHRDYGYHKSSEEQRNSGVYENTRTHERDHRGKCYNTDHQAGKETVSLKEEMKKEKMLIMVPRRWTPPASGIGVSDKVSKERAAGNHSAVKAEEPENKEKSSKESRTTQDKTQDKTHSSDSSDNNREKSPKSKCSKKKKKKKEKKKKEKKERGYKS